MLNGDPRPSYLPKDRLEAVATYQVPVTRSLEHWTLSDISTSTGCLGDRGAEHVIRALVVEPGQGLYAVAKGGVLQLTKVLAAELGPSGVRVNAIARARSRHR